MLHEIRQKNYYTGIAKTGEKPARMKLKKSESITNAPILPESLDLPKRALGPEEAILFDLLPVLLPSGRSDD